MSEATHNLSPSAALAAFFSGIGRGALWATVKAARAPLTTIVCGFAAFGMISATNNALYSQPLDHPSPFFMDQALVTSSLPPVVEPQPIVVPTTTRRVAQPAPVSTPIAPLPAMPRAVAEIGHADVMQMQEKLKSAGFYQGKSDGFYGPATANAIRLFEERHGLPQIGALTPDRLNRILSQPQPTIANNVVGNAPTRRVVQVEQIAKTVSETGTELVAAADEARQLVQQQLEAIKPDRLTQITQQVAGGGQAQQQPTQTAPVRGPGNKAYVEQVQRGLASLGFLHGEIDGVAGEGTARAVRNFEVYYNYKVTGAITPELLDLLTGAGAKV